MSAATLFLSSGQGVPIQPIMPIAPIFAVSESIIGWPFRSSERAPRETRFLILAADVLQRTIVII